MDAEPQDFVRKQAQEAQPALALPHSVTRSHGRCAPQHSEPARSRPTAALARGRARQTAPRPRPLSAAAPRSHPRGEARPHGSARRPGRRSLPPCPARRSLPPCPARVPARPAGERGRRGRPRSPDRPRLAGSGHAAVRELPAAASSGHPDTDPVTAPRGARAPPAPLCPLQRGACGLRGLRAGQTAAHAERLKDSSQCEQTTYKYLKDFTNKEHLLGEDKALLPSKSSLQETRQYSNT